jgi:hypothetical protein
MGRQRVSRRIELGLREWQCGVGWCYGILDEWYGSVVKCFVYV